MVVVSVRLHLFSLVTSGIRQAVLRPMVSMTLVASTAVAKTGGSKVSTPCEPGQGKVFFGYFLFCFVAGPTKMATQAVRDEARMRGAECLQLVYCLSTVIIWKRIYWMESVIKKKPPVDSTAPSSYVFPPTAGTLARVRITEGHLLECAESMWEEGTEGTESFALKGDYNEDRVRCAVLPGHH